MLRVVCCVFLLTACSFPGSVRPTVKIGLVAPFEGRYRYVGYDVIYAVRLALREANAAGGLGDYSVELVAYDDGGVPAQAIEQAQKLDVDPAVVAAVGHFREATTAAAVEAYADAGLPLLTTAMVRSSGMETTSRDDVSVPGGSSHSRDDNLYRLGPAPSAVAEAWRAYLRGAGLERVALITDGGAVGAALERRAEGVALVVSPDDEAGREAVLASDAEAVCCDAEPVSCGEAISALRAAGWGGQFVGGPTMVADDVPDVAGDAVAGAVFVTPWPLLDDVDGGEAFAAAYREVSNGVSPGPLALPAYEAAWVLLEALERDLAADGEPSRAGVRQALAATAREGLLGRVMFGADRSREDVPLYWYRFGADGGLERFSPDGR